MMRASILRIALMCLSSWAGAATAADTPPRAEPDCTADRAGLLASAQRAYRAARFDDAVRTGAQLAACWPDDVDAQFQYALALAASGQRRAALAVGRHAASLAPDYDAVARFVERLAQPPTRPATTDEQPPPAESAAAVSRERIGWIATATAARHSLSGGRAGWADLSAGLRRLGDDDASLGARLDVSERGDVRDVALNADLVHPLSSRTRLLARAGASLDADFTPEQTLGLGLERSVADGWVLRSEWTQRRFADVRADSLATGAEFYTGAFRFAGALTLSRLSGAGSAAAAVASTDWYASDRHRYRLTLALGNELDTIDEGNVVIETRVRSLTIAGEHAWRPRLSLGWWLGTIEQGDFYDRRYAGFSVTRRY